MKCLRVCIDHCLRCPGAGRSALSCAAFALAGLAAPCGAESVQLQGLPTDSRLSATAHVDFRVVVLPTLALSIQAQGWRVQGNSGMLTLQTDAAATTDGTTPGTSMRLGARRRAIDATLQATSASSGNIVTIAAP